MFNQFIRLFKKIRHYAGINSEEMKHIEIEKKTTKKNEKLCVKIHLEARGAYENISQHLINTVDEG